MSDGYTINEMRAFCERVERAAKAREELEVFGTAYMPLPLDADGVHYWARWKELKVAEQ